MTQTHDANAVLMGGGGPKGWKFEDPGTTRVGTIAEPPVAVQERDYDPNNPGGGTPKVFPSGDPIMGVHVVVQTTERDPSVEGDDGRRTFYVEGRYLKEAVREGVRNAGAPGLEVGGQISVTFTHREDAMDRRSRKYWQVSYTPAGNAALMAGAPQAAAAPAAPAQAPAPTYQQSSPPAWAAAAQAPAQPQAPAPAAPAAPAPAPAAPAAPATPPGLTPEQLASWNAYQASLPQA